MSNYRKTMADALREMYPLTEETQLDEATMSSSQIARLKKAYEPMRDKKISTSNADKLSAMMDKVGKDKEALIQLFKADIPFVSQSAVTKLITKHNMKGAEINKLREEVDLDERAKTPRQLINKDKEVMIVKKNKVIVIDKKDQDKYIKQGWALAEENKLEEARWKVKIEGLPSIYMDSSSAGEVKSQLRKLLKKPDMIQDIERVTDAEVKKGLRDRISGKEVEEQSNGTKGE